MVHGLAADHGQVTIFGLLDLSAAFDTVDHTVFIDSFPPVILCRSS